MNYFPGKQERQGNSRKLRFPYSAFRTLDDLRSSTYYSNDSKKYKSSKKRFLEKYTSLISTVNAATSIDYLSFSELIKHLWLGDDYIIEMYRNDLSIILRTGNFDDFINKTTRYTEYYRDFWIDKNGRLATYCGIKYDSDDGIDAYFKNNPYGFMFFVEDLTENEIYDVVSLSPALLSYHYDNPTAYRHIIQYFSPNKAVHNIIESISDQNYLNSLEETASHKMHRKYEIPFFSRGVWQLLPLDVERLIIVLNSGLYTDRTKISTFDDVREMILSIPEFNYERPSYINQYFIIDDTMPRQVILPYLFGMLSNNYEFRSLVGTKFIESNEPTPYMIGYNNINFEIDRRLMAETFASAHVLKRYGLELKEEINCHLVSSLNMNQELISLDMPEVDLIHTYLTDRETFYYYYSEFGTRSEMNVYTLTKNRSKCKETAIFKYLTHLRTQFRLPTIRKMVYIGLAIDHDKAQFLESMSSNDLVNNSVEIEYVGLGTKEKVLNLNAVFTALSGLYDLVYSDVDDTTYKFISVDQSMRYSLMRFSRWISNVKSNGIYIFKINYPIYHVIARMIHLAGTLNREVIAIKPIAALNFEIFLIVLPEGSRKIQTIERYYSTVPQFLDYLVDWYELMLDSLRERSLDLRLAFGSMNLIRKTMSQRRRISYLASMSPSPYITLYHTTTESVNYEIYVSRTLYSRSVDRQMLSYVDTDLWHVTSSILEKRLPKLQTVSFRRLYDVGLYVWINFRLPDNSRICDIGCGPEINNLHVLTSTYYYYGIDKLPRLMSNNYRLFNYDQLDFSNEGRFTERLEFHNINIIIAIFTLNLHDTTNLYQQAFTDLVRIFRARQRYQKLYILLNVYTDGTRKGGIEIVKIDADNYRLFDYGKNDDNTIDRIEPALSMEQIRVMCCLAGLIVRRINYSGERWFAYGLSGTIGNPRYASISDIDNYRKNFCFLEIEKDPNSLEWANNEYLEIILNENDMIYFDGDFILSYQEVIDHDEPNRFYEIGPYIIYNDGNVISKQWVSGPNINAQQIIQNGTTIGFQCNNMMGEDLRLYSEVLFRGNYYTIELNSALQGQQRRYTFPDDGLYLNAEVKMITNYPNLTDHLLGNNNLTLQLRSLDYYSTISLPNDSFKLTFLETATNQEIQINFKDLPISRNAVGLGLITRQISAGYRLMRVN